MEIAPYRDRYELPCVHYSDDGLRWYPILTNPIVDLTSEELEAHDYYSDPHLILRGGKMELFYRFTFLKDKQLIDNKTLLLKSVSEDGSHWSEKEVVADLRKASDVSIWGDQIISQALCWDGLMYRCWYVDKSSYQQNRNIRLSTSTDGKVWNQSVLCVLGGPVIDPWHIDVQYYDGLYQMIVYDMKNLLWYESKDGVRFDFVSEILKPSPNRYDFYTDGLYRACSVKTDVGLYVFFSAKRKQKTYIGLLQTEDRRHFTPINGMSKWKWMPIIWKPLLKSAAKRVFNK